MKHLDMNELLCGTARLVAHVDRFAGTPVRRRESVAEHSYMTAQYALFIGQECLRLGAAVDMGKLLTRAIVHDLDEAIMVDLPRPIKYADPVLKSQWHQMCCTAVQEMETNLGAAFYGSWKNAKDASLEGRILALADLISVTSYCIEEIKFGNSYMKDVLYGNLNYLWQFYEQEQSSELRALVLTAYDIATGYVHAPSSAERLNAAASRPD